MGLCRYTTVKSCGEDVTPKFQIDQRNQPYYRNKKAATTEEIILTLFDVNDKETVSLFTVNTINTS